MNVIAGERQAEELGASLAAEFLFYSVASAVLANEVILLSSSLSFFFYHHPQYHVLCYPCMRSESQLSSLLSDIEAQEERTGRGGTPGARETGDASRGV